MILRRLRFLVSLVFLALVFPGLARAAEGAAEIVISDPTGGLLAIVPGGIYIYGLLVMIAGLLSVFVKDSAMPAVLSKILNLFALNVGKAKNDPGAN
jgi:hypothetical protein